MNNILHNNHHVCIRNLETAMPGSNQVCAVRGRTEIEGHTTMKFHRYDLNIQYLAGLETN